MNCAHFEEDISAYLDGELEAGRTEQIEKHLATCECCRELRDRMTATKMAMGELPEPDVAPEDVWNFASVAGTEQPGRAFVVLSQVAAVALVAVGSFAFGIVFSSLQQRSAQLAPAPAVRTGEQRTQAPAVGGAGPREAETAMPDSTLKGGGAPTGPRGSSIATEYGSYGSAPATAGPPITVEPYKGPKPHGTARAYKITAGEIVVMVAIDRRGRILLVRSLK